MTTGELRGALAGSLQLGDRLDGWLRIEPDGTVTARTGKVEIGQGIHAALALLVAEELDVPPERVVVAPVDTAASPDEGTTSGSRSMEESGAALRQAAAELRLALLEAAAGRLGVATDSLRAEDGVVTGPDGGRVTYAELWNPEVAARTAAGIARPKLAAERRLMGSSPPRRDLARKVTGAPVYVHDLELPGMLHARVVRPPGYGARLRAVDEAAIREIDGLVAIVRDGSFLAVLAEREEQAVRALRRARRVSEWDPGPELEWHGDARYLLERESVTHVVEAVEDQRADAAGTANLRSLHAEYSRPFVAHASIGPSCAVARLDEDGMTIWSHSQGIFRLRHEASRVLRVPEESIRVIHLEGAGCYGHNGADDVGLDAALLARAVPGRPVRVQWMRDDEFAWEPFGTAMVIRLSAALDADGSIVDWTHELWGHGHGHRPSLGLPDHESGLLAAWHLEQPFAPALRGPSTARESGSQRNARPIYRFPSRRIIDHHVPDPVLRVSSLRGLGAHPNVFAIESFMDEVAAAAGIDPIELRLRHLDDERARDVLQAVTRAAQWVPGERGDGERGRGVALARYANHSAYAAVIVEVELGDELRVRRAWAAVDAGMVVSANGLRNQVEGGIVQATSWTLHEAVRAAGPEIASRGWETYPTLRFSEAPEVEVVLVDQPDEPPCGVGEAFTGPTSAAIANAIHAAIGVRVRDLPFTRERLIGAIG